MSKDGTSIKSHIGFYSYIYISPFDVFTDIYEEAFDSTKKTEEAKFKVRFDNLLSDMQQSIDNLSPRDSGVPAQYGSSSCKFNTLELSLVNFKY